MFLRGILYTAIMFLSIFIASSTRAQGVDQSVTNLGDVVIRFCNDVENRDTEAKKASKSLYMEAVTSIPEDICIYINNAWPTDITAKLNFVDGTVTADQSQKKACQPEGTKSKFWQYVEIEEDTYTVSAGKTLETHASITFPPGYAGMSYGCVTLQLEGQSESGSPDSMFTILSRRANFIDVLVDGAIKLDMSTPDQTESPFANLWSHPGLLVYKAPDTWTYKTSLIVKNDWNIAQEVAVSPFVHGRFGHELQGWWKEEKVIVGDNIETQNIFTWESAENTWVQPMKKKILPGQQVSFEMDVQDALPLWEWALELRALVQHTPVFDFESEKITPDMREMKSISLQSNLFIIPWRLLLAILALLFILWLLLWKKTTKNTPDIKKTVTRNATKKRATSTTKKIATKKKTTTARKKPTTTKKKETTKTKKTTTRRPASSTTKKKTTTAKKKTTTTKKPRTTRKKTT